jgi:hypothetical protein
MDDLRALVLFVTEIALAERDPRIHVAALRDLRRIAKQEQQVT